MIGVWIVFLAEKIRTIPLSSWLFLKCFNNPGTDRVDNDRRAGRRSEMFRIKPLVWLRNQMIKKEKKILNKKKNVK